MTQDNYGQGNFADRYDNFEDEFDLTKHDFYPRHGEAYYYPHKRLEPSRDADLARGASGTTWNRNLPDCSGYGPKNWKISDERLKEIVCDVLLRSSEVDPSELEVELKDRVVTLKGFIANRGMKNIAEDLIASIPGIEDVFSQLKYHETSNFQILQKNRGQ